MFAWPDHPPGHFPKRKCVAISLIMNIIRSTSLITSVLNDNQPEMLVCAEKLSDAITVLFISFSSFHRRDKHIVNSSVVQTVKCFFRFTYDSLQLHLHTLYEDLWSHLLILTFVLKNADPNSYRLITILEVALTSFSHCCMFRSILGKFKLWCCTITDLILCFLPLHHQSTQNLKMKLKFEICLMFLTLCQNTLAGCVSSSPCWMVRYCVPIMTLPSVGNIA